jgi:hypothetical protein
MSFKGEGRWDTSLTIPPNACTLKCIRSESEEPKTALALALLTPAVLHKSLRYILFARKLTGRIINAQLVDADIFPLILSAIAPSRGTG